MTRLWHNFRRGQERDAELDAELGSFEAMLADEYAARGETPEQARRQAHLAVGGRESVKEAVRDIRTGAGIEQALRDLRHAVRALRRSPSFSIFTILTFALAVGGVTLIVTLTNAVFLKPLPYPRSDRLVSLMEKSVNDPGHGFTVAAPNFEDWERQDTLFQRMAL